MRSLVKLGKRAFPFRKKLLEKINYDLVSTHCYPFSSSCIHMIFEFEKFFVEMCNGGGFVMGIINKIIREIQVFAGVIHNRTMGSSKSKCTGNANSTDSVQIISILDDL